MPKVSVYLPDELAAEVRRRELSLSSLTQHAVQEASCTEDTAAWVGRMRARRPMVKGDVDVAAVMAAVRDEFEE